MLEEARTRLPSETDDSEISAFSDNLISWERTLGAILNEENEYQNEVEPVNNGTSEYLLVQMISFGGEEINNFLESKNLEPVMDPFGTEIKELMPNFNIIGGVSALQQPTFGLNWLLLVPILVFLSSYLVRHRDAEAVHNAGKCQRAGQRDVYEDRYAADFGDFCFLLPGSHRHLLDFPNRRRYGTAVSAVSDVSGA